MADIQIKELGKSYGESAAHDENTLVLNDITLDVKDGGFLTFFGPNGCGKTTFLKVIAGIVPFESGTVEIDSKPPTAARTGFIFQQFSESLMPWLTARQNILFPFNFRRRRNERAEANKRLENLLGDLGLQLPMDRYPYEMSGGQQQLVAILRTLLYRPDVILMDEPFSALDFQTRLYIQDILLEMWQHEGSTILFVSHDIEEAIYLADRVVLFSSLPAQIIAIKDVSLQRPRKQTMKEWAAFIELKHACLRTVFGDSLGEAL